MEYMAKTVNSSKQFIWVCIYYYSQQCQFIEP